MLRNREVQIFIWVMGCISVIAIIIGSFISLAATITIFMTAFLLLGGSFVMTRWRYREIEKLSEYLRKIQAGDYFLDVRDNREGELSILKSEIYKSDFNVVRTGSPFARG